MFNFTINKQQQQKQEQPRREPLDRTCKKCGAQMDIFEDQYGNRKMICSSCKNFVDVEETAAEREERVRTDMRIEHMRYEKAHPIKSFFKDCFPALLLLGLGVGMLIAMKLLGWAE